MQSFHYMQINLIKFNNIYYKNSQKTNIKRRSLDLIKCSLKNNRANIILTDKYKILALEDHEQVKEEYLNHFQSLLYHGPSHCNNPGRKGEEAKERREYNREQERMRKRGE